MASNTIPDSIVKKITCRKLVPPEVPKVRSTEVVAALISKNTLRILNTIKPVTKALTAMDRIKLVRVTGTPQELSTARPCTYVVAPGPSPASQVARGNRLKSAYQMRIESID
jgi:hypothetical protein